MAGSKRGHNSRYQARNERGQFAVRTEVYYASSDDDVVPAVTRSAGANRVKGEAPTKAKFKKTPVKKGNHPRVKAGNMAVSRTAKKAPDLYYISSDSDVHGTPMPTGPRRDKVEASSGLKKGSNGEGSSGVKKKGHVVKKVSTASKKKTSKTSSFDSECFLCDPDNVHTESPTSSYAFSSDDESCDDLTELFERAMEENDKRMEKPYRQVKKKFVPKE